MPGFRIPGPIGLNPPTHDLNDGTLVRQLTPSPGPTCALSPVNQHVMKAQPAEAFPVPRKAASRPEAKVLRQGDSGADVQKLQRQLNVRLHPSPELAVDGVFGPITHHAVQQYQKGVAVIPDGVAGKQTWYHLLVGDNATFVSAPVPVVHPFVTGSAEHAAAATTPSGQRSVPPPTVTAVWEWSLQEKFVEVLRRTAPKLPGSMRHEYEALLTTGNLGIMAATLVVWAGSHAFAVGQFVDIALLVAGVVFIGIAAFDVASDLGEFIVFTSGATDENDLDTAASYLARAIVVMGIAAFSALIAKVARTKGGWGGATEAVPDFAKSKPLSSRTGPERQPPTRKPGLHNEEWDTVQSEKFKTRRQVDLTSPKDEEFAKALRKQGRGGKDIKQVLSSGSSFRFKALRHGDKLYGFNSLRNPYGLKDRDSAYWLDEAGYTDVKSKFYDNGQWDKEGVKNYLALPCYNRAEVIDTATVTKAHTAIESTIGKATEQIGYTKGDFSTGMIGKIMAGGGTQITPDSSAISPVIRLLETP